MQFLHSQVHYTTHRATVNTLFQRQNSSWQSIRKVAFWCLPWPWLEAGELLMFHSRWQRKCFPVYHRSRCVLDVAFSKELRQTHYHTKPWTAIKYVTAEKFTVYSEVSDLFGKNIVAVHFISKLLVPYFSFNHEINFPLVCNSELLMALFQHAKNIAKL